MWCFLVSAMQCRTVSSGDHGDHIGGHHLGDLGLLRGVDVENHLPHVVALRKDADQVVFDLHADGADVLFVHQRQRVEDGFERSDPDHFFCFLVEQIGNVVHWVLPRIPIAANSNSVLRLTQIGAAGRLRRLAIK